MKYEFLTPDYSLREQVKLANLRLHLLQQRLFAVSHLLNLYRDDGSNHARLMQNTGFLLIEMAAEVEQLIGAFDEAVEIDRKRRRKKK